MPSNSTRRTVTLIAIGFAFLLVGQVWAAGPSAARMTTLLPPQVPASAGATAPKPAPATTARLHAASRVRTRGFLYAPTQWGAGQGGTMATFDPSAYISQKISRTIFANIPFLTATTH